MSEKNEDQQLLADASTLLMFATAAARQASPGTGLPASGSELPSLPNAAPEALPQRAIQPLQSKSGRSSPKSAGSTTSAILSYPAGSSFVAAPSLSTDTHPQPLLPPIHADVPAHNMKGQTTLQQYHDPNSAAATHYQTPTTVLPSPNLFPPQPYDYKPHANYQQAPPQFGYAMHSQHPQQLALPHYANVNAGQQDAIYAPTRYRMLSPKSANPADHPAQKLNLSPRFSNAPVQGTFQPSHKRTSSEGSHQYYLEHHSPKHNSSTLNVALARGINVESGKRNTENAKAAAAALAAAADIPLPLRRNTDPKLRESPPADVKSIKQEDPAATDIEMDENKTDIEPESESGEVVKSEPLPSNTASEPKPARQPKEKRNGQRSVSSGKGSGKAFVAPPLESYRVEPDAGIIGCLCQVNEDDGFTIQCDICFRWQHCSCMGFKTSDEVPEDEYKCYYCDKNKWNKLDAATCRIETLKRLESENHNEPETPVPKRKSLAGTTEESKKRRRTEKEVKPPVERNPNEKRKISSSVPTGSSVTASVVAFTINNKENPLLEDGVTAEAYQSVYYRLTSNDYKTKDVKVLLEELGASIEHKAGPQSIEVMLSSQFSLIKFCQINLTNWTKYAQERRDVRRNKSLNKYQVKVKLYSDNPKQKYVGISKKGLFITDPSASQGSEAMIPAGTAVIEYLGELDYLELYMRNKVNQYSLWGTMKPKVARIDLQMDPESAPLRMVIDSRYEGNESRFIRKSCARTANCEIKPVYISDLKEFKFLVVTTRPIQLKGEDNDEELRLCWEWDDVHPIKEMIKATDVGEFKENKKFDDFDEEEKSLLVTGINTMLNFVECACNTSSLNPQCAIFKVKKATSYLLRSTRKASSLSNTSSNKSKEDLVLPSKRRDFVTWQQRLVERDNSLLVQYLDAEVSIEPSLGTATSSDDVAEATIETIDSNGAEKIKVIKLPPRKQILLQGKQLATKKYKLAPDSKPSVDISSELSSEPLANMPVPLTEQALSQIRERVNEVMKPLTDASTLIRPSLPIKTEMKVVEETPVVAAPVVTKPVSRENSPVIKLEKEQGEQKPQVVKKLSFADYKKKMK